jgi:hypothetical protein
MGWSTPDKECEIHGFHVGIDLKNGDYSSTLEAQKL